MTENGEPSLELSPSKLDNGSVPQDDLGDLDPVEFDLPPVDHVQTLEEILGESSGDNAYLTSDELEMEGTGEGSSSGPIERDLDESSELSSVVGSTVSSSLLKSNDWKKPKKQRRKSEVLRFSKVRGISNQIASAATAERVKAGTPTVLAVFSAQTIDGKKIPSLIAVGTSHGLVLVFETTQQVLKYSINTPGSGRSANLSQASSSYVLSEFGRVSAVAFSRNGLRLLIGYGKGHVQLVDSLNGKVLLTLRPDEAHQAGKGVVHLEFTDNASLAICTDSGGSVFELRFTTGLTGSTSRVRCVFSGSRGEVCAIAPLHVPQKLRHTSKHYAEPLLLAMISMTKVMVVTLKPPTQVAFATPFTGPPTGPPLLAWQWVPIQISASVKIIDPVLTFCRGHQMAFYQLHTSDGKSYRSFCLQRVELSFFPIAFQWLNSRCLAILDDQETLHLQEAGMATDGTLESVDVCNVKLVYASPDFKGLATGGNVSEAFRTLADRACYHSMGADGAGRVYLLGNNGVFTVSLRTWLERVDAFVEINDYPGAIQLALDFYSGKVKIGTGGGKSEGLSGKQSPKGNLRWRHIIAEKTVGLLLNYVENSMSRDCPLGGKISVLQEHYKAVVPVCIDACASIQRWDLLYNEIYERFSRDAVARGFFLECLEEFLLDGSLPDVPPALVQDYLYHLENEGLLGALESSIVRLPITSLDLHQVMTLCRAHELYDGIIYVHNQALKDFLTPLEEMLTKLSNEMQSSELLSDQQILLGNKILLYLSCCLCGRAYPVGSLSAQEAKSVSRAVYQFLISTKIKNSTETTKRYPYLRLLLRFDTREFLNVLSMAFNSELFEEESGREMCQRIVDILVEIVLGECDFSTVQMGGFFTFIVRLVVVQEGRLVVTRETFHQLLEAVLTKGKVSVGTSSFEERQQAVLELLQAGPTSRLLDKKVVLNWAEKGNYLQICEYLYWKERSFDKVFECYINDPYRSEMVFQLLRQFFSGSELMNSEKLSLKRKVQEKLLVVAEIDAHQCAELLIDFMQSALPVLSAQLETNQVQLYKVLSEILSYRKGSGQTSICDDENTARELAELYVGIVCQQEKQPEIVILKFLHDWEVYAKKNEKILKLCREAKAYSAVIYLLEQRLEYEEAFNVLAQALNEAISSGDDLGFDVKEIQRVGREFLSFCQRISSQQMVEVKESERQKFWFTFFDRILLLPSKDLKENIELTELLSETVHSMILVVKPADVLERLFEHPAFKGGIYSEYADMINTILKSYDYETVLLEKVSKAISTDAHSELRRNWERLRVGLHPTTSNCDDCARSAEHGPVVLFHCRHLVHVECLQKLKSFTKQADGTPNWICSLCTGKTKGLISTRDRRASSLTQMGARTTAQRRSTITDSRKLNLIQDCRKQGINPFDDDSNDVGGETIFDQLEFSLNLAPPPKRSV